MSIQQIFARNLRQLCEGRGSMSAVARDLDISHVQFHRFLRGETVPKPAVLKRICDYFGTDSRILTQSVESMRETEAIELKGISTQMAGVLGYCMRGQDYQVTQEMCPDGLYRYWAADGSTPDTYYCLPFQISTDEAGGRTLRAYHGRWMFRGTNDAEQRRQREFRGTLLKVPDGVAVILFHAAPVSRISMLHFSRNPIIADGSFIGFVAFARAEMAGFARVARCYLEPVPKTCRDIVSCAHIPPVMKGSDVPFLILEHLRHPVERFA